MEQENVTEKYGMKNNITCTFYTLAFVKEIENVADVAMSES